MFTCAWIVCKGWTTTTVGTKSAILLKSYLHGITQPPYDISVHQAFFRRKDEISDSSGGVIGKTFFIFEAIIGKVSNLLFRNIKARHEILLLLALFYKSYLIIIS